jgi:O-antigen/teichoic acid export membrane protein
MSDHKEAFKKAIFLSGARVFGVIFSIVIPMYLGRKLSVETYGTYKQIMLFFWFSNVALNLGLDDSAFFLHRKNPREFSLYSFNALIFNLLVTTLIAGIFTVFNVEVAALVGNPNLAEYLPLLGILTVLTVSSMQLEGLVYIGLNRFNERLYIEMSTEFLKSAFVVCGFYFFNSITAVLVLFCSLMFIRLLAVAVLIVQGRNKEHLSFVQGMSHLSFQIRYGVPLGFSRIIQNLLNIENYFISKFFSLKEFTFYSVGCFENPLVNAARSSMFELVNIDLVDATKHGLYDKAVEAWRRMTRKLFLIVVPFVVYMMFFAHEIIVFIFSDKYLNSVPYFVVFNLYLFVGSLNPEPLFRATSATMTALRIKTVGVIVGLTLFISGALLLGPIWALTGKIFSVFLMNITGLVIGARLLHSNFRSLFQWKDLFGVIAVSIGIGLILRLAFQGLTWHPFFVLAASFSLYVLIHFAVSSACHLIRPDELDFLKSTLFKILRLNKIQR